MSLIACMCISLRHVPYNVDDVDDLVTSMMELNVERAATMPSDVVKVEQVKESCGDK